VIHPHGDLPLLTIDRSKLQATAVTTINEVTKGTLVPQACSGRGTCDELKGQCKCVPQYGSSNGEASEGDIGDCGLYDSRYGAGIKTATRYVVDASGTARMAPNMTTIIRGGGTPEDRERLAKLALSAKFRDVQP
jgi:hypothetical protein